MKTKILTGLVLASVLVLAPACTNKQGESESPVFITLDLPNQPLTIDVNIPAPVTVATITLASHLKDASATDPQGFANVQVSFYTVSFFRQDAGTMVPATQTFATAGLLPSNGSLTLTGFPILAASAVQLSPFDQLLPFNGGIDRETGLNEIHMFYKLTFFGDTVSGHRVQSETATGDFFVQ